MLECGTVAAFSVGMDQGSAFLPNSKRRHAIRLNTKP